MRKKLRKSTNTEKFNPIAAIAIVILAIFVCSIAYSTCSNNEKEENLSRLSGNIDEQRLTEVITPTLDDAQMIHYPGFDVMFSNVHRQPYYVAWVLTPEHAQATEFSRSNNFRPDPDITNSAQLSDYKHSGYDRGHMAPSADFRYSQEAQDATFFMTNMSPQHNSLNSKAWANLEDQCRAWAKRDSTLIIITGPVLSDYLTETIGENKITVPARYFKVVLAPYANPPHAIGFIMPNQYVQGGVQSTAMSVDEVEEITGYDFFSELPDELENSIESSGRYTQWQYPKKKKSKD